MKDNFKEERLLILHMIYEGKVTPEEGNKLLGAMRASAAEEHEGIDMEDKINKFSSSVDSFAKDVGDKIGTAFKDAEPKIKKATKIALEKTALVVKDISESLNDTIKNMDEKEKNESCQEDKTLTDIEKDITEIEKELTPDSDNDKTEN